MPRTLEDEAKINKIIGERIRKYRILKHLTTEEFGCELGISHQQVHKYESGKDKITAAKLYKVISILKITSEDIMCNNSNIDDLQLNRSRFYIELTKNLNKLSEEQLYSLSDFVRKIVKM